MTTKPDKSGFSNLSRFMSQQDTGETGDTDAPDNDNHGEADSDGEGKRVSTEVVNNDKKDLREFLLPEDQAAAERAAADRQCHTLPALAALEGGAQGRQSIFAGSSAGRYPATEPMQLLRKRRPDGRCICQAHSRRVGVHDALRPRVPRLLRGLIDVDQRADAFLSAPA